MTIISQKMCTIGDFGVGKTSLIRRFVDGQFSDQYLSTVGVKISHKVVEAIGDRSGTPKNVKLLIWDLEGHTKFKSIAPSYLQGAKGALIVGDVTRPETIERFCDHIKLFLSVNPKGIIILTLNKTDLVEPQKLEKLAELARNQQTEQVLALYKTSAKTGENVQGIFDTLARKMLQPLSAS
ncbi:Rab family GTPase [Oscillatoria sp. FACHB-1406]|uniref:Rab family GTPase n=1 Tax=Oscillatoria sp. FACHB-1406 TaxID=2692846 RepID=UPI001685BD38|nr:Rab family GTPase [Oscillatoria sp. FACHB-1406]MBD2577095.1 GTP-binding protein [Oscillatoria sp. FACHB-1406]